MSKAKALGAVAMAAVAIFAVVLFLQPFGGSAEAEDEPGVRVPEGGTALADGLDARAALAFSDGKITRAEYTAAIDAAVDCIVSAGYPVSGPAWATAPDGSGELYGYTVGPFASKAELDASKPVQNSCHITHARGVDAAWQIAQR